jgi:hypothetical protein
MVIYSVVFVGCVTHYEYEKGLTSNVSNNIIRTRNVLSCGFVCTSFYKANNSVTSHLLLVEFKDGSTVF